MFITVRRIEIWAVLTRNEVVLLMLRSRIFKLGIVQKYAEELRIHVAKRSDMGNAFAKGLRFADTQESCFEPWNRSHLGSSALLCYVVDLLILRNRV